MAYMYLIERIKLFRKLLPILDNLELSYDYYGDDGLGLIVKEFKNVFKEYNVEEIDCLNKPFDYLFCEAIDTVQNKAKENGIVSKVIRKGYTINGQVLRYARVIVVNND